MADSKDTSSNFRGSPVGHEPVLLRPVLDQLNVRPGQTIVDCTIGRGGHAIALADRLGPTGTLIGLDADPRNLEFAAARLASLPCDRRLFHANFSELPVVLSQAGESGRPLRVDALLADLGVSTNQLFDEQYGLSFARPMPLDMRLDPGTRKSAADWVNGLPEEELADVLYKWGDERYSRRIAAKIVDARRRSPITTTDRLADLVRSAVPMTRPKGYRDGRPIERIDPATRTFMALRIVVNDEPRNLRRLLETAPTALKPGGRLAVISFHSGEDRVVKNALRDLAAADTLELLTKKPVTPDEAELAANPRSRSAKLRAARRRE